MKPVYWFILMLSVIALPLFSHLDSFPLQLWDESRLANNAFEMLETGNYLVTTYTFLPETWNLKPPLMVWLIALSMKLLGNGELAIRLPSVIIAVLTCIMLFRFLYKKTDNPRLAFFACFVLITSFGYVRTHGVRTADYESLLAFCTVGYLTNYYTYINEQSRKHLFYFFVFLSLSVLTKSAAGLLFLPGLFIYTLYKKQLLSLFKTKQLYAGLLLFLILVAGYYLLRENTTPGYLQAVWDNELGGRYNTALEEHKADNDFYFFRLTQDKFKYWIVIAGLALAHALVNENKKHQSLVAFSFITAVSFLLIISLASTKLDWYDLPMYPLLAIIVAVFIEHLLKTIWEASTDKKIRFSIIAIVIFALFIPHHEILQRSMYPHRDGSLEENHHMALFLSNTMRNNDDIKGYVFTDDSRADQNIVYYINVLKEKNNLKYKELQYLDIGDKVVVFKDKKMRELEAMYHSDIVGTFANVKVYHINGKK